MELYYTDQKNIFANYLMITGAEAHHISKVMRHKVNDMIFVTDGQDNEYQIMIKSIDKNSIRADIINKSRKVRETTARITLAQSVIKGNHMDFVIEKAAELGAHEIIPIITERTIASVSDKKIERYQKIMLAAMKSSTRTHLPKIIKPIAFDKLLDMIDQFDIVLVAYEEEERNNRLTNVLPKNELSKILLIIGPEGGFSNAEISKVKTRGAKSFSIGPRRFRAETAALAALSVLLYELKEI